MTNTTQRTTTRRIASGAAPVAHSLDPKTRSLELAQAHGETSCSHNARCIGWTLGECGELVNAAWRIDSATVADITYAVSYEAASDDAQCDCLAAQHDRGCWHRGLGILLGREMAQAYTPMSCAASRQEQRAAESW